MYDVLHWQEDDAAAIANGGAAAFASWRAALKERNDKDDGGSWSQQDGFHLYYTSGTTGVPKGVLLSHRVVLWHALGAMEGECVCKSAEAQGLRLSS